jgi:hypothetical protein
MIICYKIDCVTAELAFKFDVASSFSSTRNNIILVCWLGKDILKNTVQCMIYVENAAMGKF